MADIIKRVDEINKMIDDAIKNRDAKTLKILSQELDSILKNI